MAHAFLVFEMGDVRADKRIPVSYHHPTIPQNLCAALRAAGGSADQAYGFLVVRGPAAVRTDARV